MGRRAETKVGRIYFVSVHTRYVVVQDRSAAALGAVGRPSEILVVSDSTRSGVRKGDKKVVVAGARWGGGVWTQSLGTQAGLAEWDWGCAPLTGVCAGITHHTDGRAPPGPAKCAFSRVPLSSVRSAENARKKHIVNKTSYEGAVLDQWKTLTTARRARNRRPA